MELRRQGVTDTAILSAIETTPRELFVPTVFQDRAYENNALPIEGGQTISQPFIVAFMTCALNIGPRHRVLEIGTGSGYQTAILAQFAKRVFTIERRATLMRAAETRFRKLRLINVDTLVGDGTRGWVEQAPFDRIIVTAAAETVPEALKKQVRIGGVIVIPVGPQDGVQKLLRLERTDDGFAEKVLADVRFVPLIPGKAAHL